MKKIWHVIFFNVRREIVTVKSFDKKSLAEEYFENAVSQRFIAKLVQGDYKCQCSHIIIGGVAAA